MKRVLIDASSAILLYKVGLLGTLVEDYRVLMADTVYRECTREGYPGAGHFPALFQSERFAVKPFNGNPAELSTLGTGERDTILGYLQGAGDFVMIDDGRGAQTCRNMDVPFINALLFPRIRYLRQKSSHTTYQRHFDRLLSVGRYSPKIIAYAAACSLADLAFFLP